MRKVGGGARDLSRARELDHTRCTWDTAVLGYLVGSIGGAGKSGVSVDLP